MVRNAQMLTKGEEEVMRILWMLGEATVNEIIARMEEPKPKYTTVATFIKILENKGFVAHRAAGKGFSYYPLLEKSEYAGSVANNLLSNYFNGSLSQMVSFFSQQENISVSEMDEILRIVKDLKK
ncbi:MAG: BlaI/MecI/CopY family transcriptional regulator [Alistipes sp.]|nr:BlaI/MecI/CopY family transcriptional regulator [Alistipes sp.]